METLNHSAISAELDTATRESLTELILLDIVNSTNSYLQSLITPTPQTLACFAEQQTQGRGRNGKTWISPNGNIYFSLLWHVSKNPNKLMGLSLVVAMAVVNALKKYGVTENLGIKWPNDILLNDKKLAGILLELHQTNINNCNVIIGIGLNIKISTEHGNSINQAWTCLADYHDKKIERNRLAAYLLNALIQYLNIFQNQGLPAFLNEWQGLDLLNGRSVILHTPTEQLNGVMQGITERGELILLNSNGAQQFFLSGDVSVRRL